MMQSRRVFLRYLGKGIFFVASYPVLGTNVFGATTVRPTPPNTEGPFYRAGAPLKNNLREAGESGTSLAVTGSVVDIHSNPIPESLIEIWHTDSSGEYDHSGYSHRASLRTSKQGNYGFETVMPGGYGNRPRHIHYKIHANGFDPLVTQLYFEDDPFFEGDPEANLRKDSLVRYRELIRPVVPYREGKPAKVIFQICLSRE